MERGNGPQLVSIRRVVGSPAACRYEELDDFIDIALFDHDEVGKDDRMGRVEIDLRELSREVPAKSHSFHFQCYVVSV